MESLRIAFVSPGHPVFDRYAVGGGIQGQVQRLATHLAERGHEVTVIKRWFPDERLPKDGVRYETPHVRARGEVWGPLGLSRAAATILRRDRPDAVYLSERFSAYYPSKTGLPCVFKAHNMDTFAFFRWTAYRSNPVNLVAFDAKTWFERAIMRRSRRVLVATPTGRDILRRANVRGARVFPNCVEIPDEAASAGKIPEILYGGRLHWSKGVRELWRAFRIVCTRRPDARLRFMGDGPDATWLGRRSAATTNVTIDPWAPRSALQAAMASATIFAAPSHFEMAGNSVLEAMATGLPVVASGYPGVPDIVKDGETGCLVPPRDPDTLARVVAALLDDPERRHSLGKRARAEAQAKYSFERGAATLEALLREACADAASEESRG